MEEKNNQISEIQETAKKNESTDSTPKKAMPKTTIIIGIAAVVVVAIVVALILLLGGNKNSTSNPDETPAHTHEYGEWETTKTATCTAEGIKERYCSCGEKQITTIAATNHEFGEWNVSKDSTFTDDGEEIRFCSCGKTEIRTIPKQTKPIEMSLTKPQYIAELQEIFLNTSEQKALYIDDSYQIVGRYFDGNEYVVYFSNGDSEQFIGKVDNEYILLGKRENSKTCDHISYDEFIGVVEYINEMLFDDIWDYASLEDDSDNGFECKKTVSEKTVYTVKGVSGITAHNVTVTVINGLITEISLESVTEYNGKYYTDFEVVTFEYDKIREMPDKTEYCTH